MSWKFSWIASSLSGMLRDTDSTASVDTQLEHIREELLACMLPCIKELNSQPPVWSRVLYSTDIQSLWFLRSDVMQILCEHVGETRASQTMARITDMFRGAIPDTQLKSVRIARLRR